jgi:hypothetical protein
MMSNNIIYFYDEQILFRLWCSWRKTGQDTLWPGRSWSSENKDGYDISRCFLISPLRVKCDPREAVGP